MLRRPIEITAKSGHPRNGTRRSAVLKPVVIEQAVLDRRVITIRRVEHVTLIPEGRARATHTIIIEEQRDHLDEPAQLCLTNDEKRVRISARKSRNNRKSAFIRRAGLLLAEQRREIQMRVVTQ